MYRILSSQLKKSTDRVLVLFGARQVGKTTLLKNCFPESIYINLEIGNYLEVFNSRDLKRIAQIVQLEHGRKSKIWILDEVQRLNDPGLLAKVIHDEMKNVHLIISGSSSLEIANKASESLAGRKKTLTLYPLTFAEKLIQTKKLPQSFLKPGARHLHLHAANRSTGSVKQSLRQKSTDNYNLKFNTELKEAMQYGFYPKLLDLQSKIQKEEYLLELADSIIFKDVYYLNILKNTRNLALLLKLLAYQIGQQINITELSNRLGIARQTVVDYIEILKQTFLVFTLPPYTKKRRDEIAKTEKIYFHDIGLRNALINDFSPVEFRTDYGSIFENFVISEIMKLNQYYRERFSMYYWRTKWGSEVDLVLVRDEKYKAIEIKTRKSAITPAFKATYPEAEEFIITMDNIVSVLVPSGRPEESAKKFNVPGPRESVDVGQSLP